MIEIEQCRPEPAASEHQRRCPRVSVGGRPPGDQQRSIDVGRSQTPSARPAFTPREASRGSLRRPSLARRAGTRAPACPEGAVVLNVEGRVAAQDDFQHSQSVVLDHVRRLPRIVEAVSQTNGTGAKRQRLGRQRKRDASGELLRASAGSARLICLDAERCSWRSITNNFRSVTFVKQPCVPNVEGGSM